MATLQTTPKIPAPSAPLLKHLQELKTELARYHEIKARRDRAVTSQQAATAEMAELHGERARASQFAFIDPRAVVRLEDKTAIIRERSLEAVATVRETQRE